MENLFNMDNKFFIFMSRVADLVILNMLWLIFCLPIVTIGSSTTALYYVTLKMSQNEEAYIAKSFFKSFKENLKQGCILTLIMLSGGIILYLDFTMILSIDFSFKAAFIAVLSLTSVVYIFCLSYIFPVLARFDNSILPMLKNSFLMSIRHLPYTMVISFLNLVPFLLLLFAPYYFFVSLIFWILLGFSLTAYINSGLLVKIFQNYMPPEAM